MNNNSSFILNPFSTNLIKDALFGFSLYFFIRHLRTLTITPLLFLVGKAAESTYTKRSSFLYLRTFFIDLNGKKKQTNNAFYLFLCMIPALARKLNPVSYSVTYIHFSFFFHKTKHHRNNQTQTGGYYFNRWVNCLIICDLAKQEKPDLGL